MPDGPISASLVTAIAVIVVVTLAFGITVGRRSVRAEFCQRVRSAWLHEELYHDAAVSVLEWTMRWSRQEATDFLKEKK